MKNKVINQKEYEYGFSDINTSIVSLKKGLSVDVIKKISVIKDEPK
jgi:hypothetical protein